ncbi:MAG: lipid-A-disaccharide synthase, partial [Bacteroidetes bacterium]|nr:lipid-A-disaccharide synthase [Fibrella sp.]
KMFVIFPFEVDFYKKYDFAVEYVGNPLLDALAAFRADPAFRQKMGAGKPLVALLPGSRRQEVTTILPTMLAVSRDFPDYRFVVSTVNNLPTALYNDLLRNYPDVGRAADAAYDLLSVSTAALVASGTATLETALLHIPQVVCYKTGRISYEIARRVIAVRFISLVNLIMDRAIVPELIQHECTAGRVAAELRTILPGGDQRLVQLSDYADLQRRMGEPGASERAGTRMVELASL